MIKTKPDFWLASALKPRSQNCQRGDTLIAVIISISIVSLIILVSYFLINRTVVLNQQSRHQSLVTKILESQVEGLKNLAFNGDRSIFETTNNPNSTLYPDDKADFFCLDKHSKKNKLTKPVSADYQNEFQRSGKYSNQKPWLTNDEPLANCQGLDQLPTSVDLQILIEYYPDVDQDQNTADKNQFFVRASWISVLDPTQRNEAMLVIRLHPLRTK